MGLIAEFLELWAVIPEVEDLHSWCFSSSDLYSAKSACIELFQGAVLFGPWERIWRSWAPGKCHFFYVAGGWWLTTNVGQLIDLKREVCHTQPAAPSVTRSLKRSTICWLVACLPDNSGSCCSKGLGCRAVLCSLWSYPLMIGGLMQVPRLMGRSDRTSGLV